MENDNIIDLGSITVPTSWDEITLKQFQEIEKYYADKDKKFDVRDIMHILIEKDVDFINSLPMEFTEKILEKLMFLQDKPEEKEPSNKITIDSEEYIINVMEKLKTGEYLAVDAIIKDDKFNYAAILAVICRKEGEVYDSKYENEVVGERIKMWENVSVVKVLSLISFFLNLYLISQLPTLLSSELQEGINHIRESIKSSRENGELSALSTRRLMRKLKKLEKSIASI